MLAEESAMERSAARADSSIQPRDTQTSVRASGAARFRPTYVYVLLASGIASSLLYVVMDIVCALRYEGYAYRAQTISELSAVGAPTRNLWVAMSVPYALLVLAFAIGVIASAKERRSLRAAGALLAIFGILALVAWPFAPMHQRDVLAAGGGTAADTMHLVLSAVDVALVLMIIVLAAYAIGGRFRAYSIATIAALLVFGALTGTEAPRVADNLSTPWVGVTERVSVFAFLLWFAILGSVLMYRTAR
jgi:hypothetical protein